MPLLLQTVRASTAPVAIYSGTVTESSAPFRRPPFWHLVNPAGRAILRKPFLARQPSMHGCIVFLLRKLRRQARSYRSSFVTHDSAAAVIVLRILISFRGLFATTTATGTRASDLQTIYRNKR
jgi:hypothetical protein